MRVAFAHDHIFKKDNFGNFYTAGSFNNEVWKRYLKHFNEITVIARLDKNEVALDNKYNNFDLPQASFIPVPTLSGPIAQVKNKSVACKKIREVLEKSDALIARLPSEIGNLAVEIAKEMNKPYSVEVVACVWDSLWNYGNIQAKLYAPFATNKMKRVVKKSPYAVYVTNKFLQTRYPCSGITENISNVEIKQINDATLSKRLEHYESNKPLLKIGMIGSLNNRIKGWDVAFKALNILEKNKIDFEFHILGDGNTEQWINVSNQLGLNKKVIFHGVLPGGDPVFNWLDDIDIYIQPSFQEGLPRAIIEAMSRGCPVVGSTAGGIPELINDSCLHSPADFKMLAQKIELVMKDNKHAIDLAKENFEESKKYDKEILDKKRVTFWKSFISDF